MREVSYSSTSNKPLSAATSSEANKGKGKSTDEDVVMREEEEDDDEEEEEEEEEEEDNEVDEEDEDTPDDEMEEIDPSVITRRRTRGIRVNYASEEAYNKAGLVRGITPESDDD
ncbi:hypothetical protein ID866_4876 [Astraeus odoratus]|nr:hypothetical protein ID866_4876 [Astraeus odoratus]